MAAELPSGSATASPRYASGSSSPRPAPDASPAEVEILIAVKYVAPDDFAALADAGVTLVGENRAQDLLEKVALATGRLRWHFIGALQSRKVRADRAAR